MRRAGALVLAASLMGALAASAGGRQAATVRLRLHGTLELAGSKVVCGLGLATGVYFVDCGIPGATGNPKHGSYVALVAATGKVSVAHAPDGKIVFNRVGGLLERDAVVVAHPGDLVLPVGVKSIFCSATRVSGAPTIFCDHVDAKGNVRAGGYAFGINDTVVTVITWDAKRKPRLVDSWPENG